MSWESIRSAALAALLAGHLTAAPVATSAGSEENGGIRSAVVQIWEWLQGVLPDPGPAPDCTEDCGDAGYGVDPNG